jgi:hypothetical protein
MRNSKYTENELNTLIGCSTSMAFTIIDMVEHQNSNDVCPFCNKGGKEHLYGCAYLSAKLYLSAKKY